MADPYRVSTESLNLCSPTCLDPHVSIGKILMGHNPDFHPLSILSILDSTDFYSLSGFRYPLVICDIAIENGHRNS